MYTCIQLIFDDRPKARVVFDFSVRPTRTQELPESEWLSIRKLVLT